MVFPPVKFIYLNRHAVIHRASGFNRKKRLKP